MATIQKRSGSFKITVSSGYDIDGNQIRHTMTWTPPYGMTARQIEKEATRQAVLFEEQVRQGQVLEGNIRFADFSEQWLHDYAETQLRPTTIHSYRSIIERLNHIIGNIRLDKLRPAHILNLYNVLNQNGTSQRASSVERKEQIDLKQLIRSNGFTMDQFAEEAGIAIRTLREAYNGRHVALQSAKKISKALHCHLEDIFILPDGDNKLDPSTIRKYHAVLSSLLSTAVKWQLIPYNPCERVQPPKLVHKDMLATVYKGNIIKINNGLPILRRDTAQTRLRAVFL